jgi:cell division septum initiation protein DivIVA
MALTRKLLKAMGIDDSIIDQIIEAHTETVDGLKSEISTSKSTAESSTQKIAELEKQIEELKNTAVVNEGKNPWKVKYDALKEEFEGFKTEEANKVTKAAKEKAYRELLKNTGVAEKRIASVMKVSDIDSIELDESGKIKDEEKYKTNIQNEWSDFITSTETKGADTPTPPTNDGGNDAGDDDAINRIIAQRADLYGAQE